MRSSLEWPKQYDDSSKHAAKWSQTGGPLRRSALLSFRSSTHRLDYSTFLAIPKEQNPLLRIGIRVGELDSSRVPRPQCYHNTQVAAER